MKKSFDKEILIGACVLILLSILAAVLIIRRENPNKKSNQVKIEAEVVETQSEDEVYVEEAAYDLYREVETEEIIIEEPDNSIVPDNITKTTKEEVKDTKLDEYMLDTKLFTYTGDDMWQLEELYHYWSDYQLDAVDDLIRLPRVRTMTNELSGSNGFYYYGDVDKNGMPSGKGIAVYANNAYYCGEWANGKRHGNGMWIQVFPDKLGVVNGVSGVEEHNYNGTWANDYPNGNGQEHISYVYDEVQKDKNTKYMISNVIGSFKDGYYDGELYIMTTESENDQNDWEAKAKKGTYEYWENKQSASGEKCVWKKMKEKEDIYYWIHPDDNVNHGIYGLKKK